MKRWRKHHLLTFNGSDVCQFTATSGMFSWVKEGWDCIHHSAYSHWAGQQKKYYVATEHKLLACFHHFLANLILGYFYAFYSSSPTALHCSFGFQLLTFLFLQPTFSKSLCILNQIRKPSDAQLKLSLLQLSQVLN